jgi:hypothetical protein
LKEIV